MIVEMILRDTAWLANKQSLLETGGKQLLTLVLEHYLQKRSLFLIMKNWQNIAVYYYCPIIF